MLKNIGFFSGHGVVFLKLALFFSLCVVAFSAFSQALSFETANKTITTIGVHGDNYYFRVLEPLEAQCAYSIIYIPASKKPLYVQALAAKLAGKKLSRINYTLTNGPNSECHAYIVEME
ncbi:hypothetical protein [Janthinobacterium lividum]|uniref:hypothetical protein n=1 Tax=Janthinobacterium lividum TaxID=29581 RepID=UPI00140C5867|nr:hypothetical protein [Janthinobacterium lividum]NHQ90308.1 hypothetical protein [Janthinobacterium lividum]